MKRTVPDRDPRVYHLQQAAQRPISITSPPPHIVKVPLFYIDMVATGGGPYQKGGRRSWRLPPLYQGWELQLKTPYIKGSGCIWGTPPLYEEWQLQPEDIPYMKDGSCSWHPLSPIRRVTASAGDPPNPIRDPTIRWVAAAVGYPRIRSEGWQLQLETLL